MLPVYGEKNSMFKAYVVIYTCAASRAVILEVVNSNNTQNCIQSFRRRCPAVMISGNGSSFIAHETQRLAADHFL